MKKKLQTVSRKNSSRARTKVSSQKKTHEALSRFKKQPRWTAYKQIPRGEGYQKVPFIAEKTHARVNAPDNWLSYKAALKLSRSKGFAGIGILLGKYSDRFSLCGVDLDSCFDATTQTLAPWAAEICKKLKAYVEVSPSGTGVKIFFIASRTAIKALRDQGLLPTSENRIEFKSQTSAPHAPGIECDFAARYYTVTGKKLVGADDTVRQVKLSTLKWLLGTAGPEYLRSNGQPQAARVPEVIAAILARANATKRLRQLVAGNFTSLKRDRTRSARDIAFVGELKRMGVTEHEVRAAVLAFPHGAAAEKQAQGDDRYFDRMWERAYTRADVPPALPLPVIRIEAGNLIAAVDHAEAALLRAGALVFRRGELIVQPVLADVQAAGGVSVTTQRLRPLTAAALTEELSRVAVFEKPAKENEWRRIDCPQSLALALLARPNSRLRPILNIISAPTMRRDASILSAPGYDASTMLFLEPRGVVFPEIPEFPTRDDAKAALAVLEEVISTFPFVSPEDRSTAVSAIVSALLRPTLRKVPLHAFTAPSAGTGKSLLADVVSIIATGAPCPVQAQGATKEEADKRIGTALMSGDAIVCIDNCSMPLGGDKLCQGLTQDVVTTRLLGHAKNIDSPAGCFFMATGNNLRILADLTRRTLLCALDANHENPELRKFDRDASEYAKTKRGECVVAALTITRAYKLAGSPKFEGKKHALGSFNQWSSTVRDALMWAGAADPCATQARARDSDPEREQRAGLLRSWKAAVSTKAVTLKELTEFALSDQKTADELKQALMAIAGEAQSINTRRLAIYVAKIQGQIERGYRIVKAPGRSGVTRWRLEKVED